jgi:hypothetical protein
LLLPLDDLDDLDEDDLGDFLTSTFIDISFKSVNAPQRKRVSKCNLLVNILFVLTRKVFKTNALIIAPSNIKSWLLLDETTWQLHYYSMCLHDKVLVGEIE